MRRLSMRRIGPWTAALVGTMAVALAMSSVASPRAGATTVRVAVTAADAVPVYLGIQQGTFAKAGLEVRVVKVDSSIAAVNAVLHGKADFGAADTATLLAAAPSTGLKIVAGSTTATNGMSSVLVATSGANTTSASLTGVSVGVPELHGLAALSVPGWLADVASVDGSTNTYSVVSSRAAAAALKGNTVQAVVTVWPYNTKTAGVKSLGDPIFSELGAGATSSAWFAKTSTLGSKAQASKSFVSALAKAIAGTKNKALARRAITATGAPATAIALKYAAKLNPDSVDDIGFKLLDAGIVSEQPDTAALTWKGAPKK